MEAGITHASSGSGTSSAKKCSADAVNGGGGNQVPAPTTTTESNSGGGSNNNSVSSSNPIFVITNSSSSSSLGGSGTVVGVSGASNSNEMPSNSIAIAGDVAISNSTGIPSSEEDDGGGGGDGSCAGVNNTTATAVPSRSGNPRQSTLTRSHAITLDEDSDSGAGGEGGGLGAEQEQELIHFLIDTCNKSAKDKNFILRIEADLIQFVKDESRQTLPFPQMTSYQRMLVHRMATLFDLDHNVDNSSGGNFVVVSKDLTPSGAAGGTLRGGRIPPIRFKELNIMPPAMVPSSSHLNTSSLEHQSSTEDPPSNTPTTVSKKILKREKPASLDGKKGGGGLGTKTKSLEERTQDYHKARRRIFEDSGDQGTSMENSSSKKLNWSSTDSSEDKMYLKPPFPGTQGAGKLIKVESFESASQKKSRDSRQMGKSHSFGGYEDNAQIQGGPVGGVSSRGGAGATTKNTSSNNASSSMISCSSSSSLRSSSFSKQDSSSSTTSGSGQSPSGGTSSGSTSGYKSGSSGGLGQQQVVTGYYTASGGMMGGHGANTMGVVAPAHLPAVSQQPNSEMMKNPPAVIFAPSPATQQYVAQPQLPMSPEENMSSSNSNSSQPVLFCCWALTDLTNVPPGAMIIDPSSGQSIKNNDGSQYYYDPNNPPKFIQAIPTPLQHPPPPATPQPPESYQQAQPQPPQAQVMYPQTIITTGAPIAYAAPPPPQTPTSQHMGSMPATFMTVPTGGAPQFYISNQPAPAAGGSQDVQDLSGYFSQLTMSQGGAPSPTSGRPSVIYVPVDALGQPAYAVPPEPQQQGSQGAYYEDGQQPQQQQQQQVSQFPVQFQAAAPAGSGYVLQPVIDSGASPGGVYYYSGGNFVQAATTPTTGGVQALQASSNTAPSSHHNPHHHHPQHQPRFKNWIGLPQQQGFGMHGTSSHSGSGSGSSNINMGSSQQHQLPVAPAPAGAIMIHSNAPPPTSMGTGGAGLVSILPPQGQMMGPPPQSGNSALLPVTYHPHQHHHHHHHHPSQSSQSSAGGGGSTPQPTLMQTLVPCVQQSPYPPPPPPQHPPQPPHSQSFVQPPHHHHQHPPPHSTSSSSTRHHHPHHQPRFLAVTSPAAAAAAAVAAASSSHQHQLQQQQQLQLQFLANAAAAAMMTNNYSFTAPTRFLSKARSSSVSGPTSTPHHAPVTGVVRRSRNYSTSKQQQPHSSK